MMNFRCLSPLAGVRDATLQPRRSRSRRGFTLLELLVIILILLSVTAISIPLIVPAMAGRQVREGARMVSSFISAARSRAIETGRPAGVWIERLPGLREASANLYYAEIPPTYAGDFLDSQAELFCVNGVPGATEVTGSYNFTWESTDANCRDYWNIIVPRGRTTWNMDSWASPDQLDQQIVREGDLIQLEGSERRIPLKIVKMNLTSVGGTSASSKNLWWYLYRGRNCAAGLGPDGAYTNERSLTGEYTIRWFDQQNWIQSGLRVTTNRPFNPNVNGLKYRIFRQPIKLQAGAMKLPDGCVIDLGFSSITNGDRGNSGVPFHPRGNDPRNINVPWWGAAPYPNDDTPIIFVFSPGGHMERIYFRNSEGLASSGNANRQYVWGGSDPYGQIHLLIGKIEKVIPDEFYLYSQGPLRNMEIQQKKNWLDNDSIWVNVNPQTGFISTSLVDDVGSSTTYYDPNNTETGASNPNNIWVTREKARAGRVIGGN